MTEIDLTGRTAVITGGGRGLGFGAAHELAAAGACVVISELDESVAAAAVDRLPGSGHAAVEADASDPASHARLAAAAVAATGGLHVWVNNAGLIGPIPIDAGPAEWNRSVDLMLTGVFFGCQAAAGAMHNGGSIVNISSIAAERSMAPGAHAYSATKAGVLGLTRAMAVELGPKNIRVNAIAPGFFRTEGTAAFEAANPEMAGMIDLLPIPLGRQGRPEDVGRVVLLLVSDLAGYVTGVTIPVDGGFMA